MSRSELDQLLNLWNSPTEESSTTRTAHLIRKLVRAESHEEALKKIELLDVLDLSVDPWMKRPWQLDLEVFKLLPKVRGLKLNGSKVSCLSVLKSLSDLEQLFIDEMDVENIDFVSQMPVLEVISARRNKLRSLEPLRFCPQLREVLVTENNLTTLSCLLGLQSLRVLDVSQNMISDLTPLAKLRNLRVLRLQRNGLTQLDGLEDLINLDELDVRDNRIMSLRPIKSLGLLSTLGIAGNPLTDDDVDTIRRSIKLLS
ncbi:MAG: hypothetical protein RJB13_156 [Pseudomonadota bacterium]|jgi:Leucine-rich repeat (LRR) protein